MEHLVSRCRAFDLCSHLAAANVACVWSECAPNERATQMGARATRMALCQLLAPKKSFVFISSRQLNKWIIISSDD